MSAIRVTLWFSTRDDFAPRGRVAMSGDLFGVTEGAATGT